MSTTSPIVVVGAGPAGMAAAMALHKVGHEVVLLERHDGATLATGSGLSLFAPVVKALAALGVDIAGLGAPCHVTFERPDGRILADVKFPPEVSEYGGGFFGLLRPELYRRMAAALPSGVLRTGTSVESVEDKGDSVLVTLGDGEQICSPLVIGADGINSVVRRTLWGDSPVREHRLHVLCGFTFEMPPTARRDACVIALDRTIQGSYSSIVDHGRPGYQWWMLEAWDPHAEPPANLRSRALSAAAGFDDGVRDLIRATRDEDVFRWPVRDRKTLPRWSKGRITLTGDAAHATSQYAAYGAGMSIVDGFFLGQVFAEVDLRDAVSVATALRNYEALRIGHTTGQVQQAWVLGQVLHHAPRILRPLRDTALNHTKMMQRQVGDKSPAEISAQLGQMNAAVFTARS